METFLSLSGTAGAVRGLIFLIVLAAVLLFVAVKSLAITKEGERLVVFRLGKFLGVLPPGLNIIVPFIDRTVTVRVDRIIGWQTLSETELVNRITEDALRDPQFFRNHG